MSDTLDLPDDLFERVEYPEDVLIMGGGPRGEWAEEWTCMDVTWAYELAIDKYYDCREFFLDLQITALIKLDWDFHEEYTAYIDEIRDFDFMGAVTSNEYNPFKIGAEYFIEYGNWATKTFLDNEAGIDFTGSNSPPDDGWLEVFGDVYETYWL